MENKNQDTNKQKLIGLINRISGKASEQQRWAVYYNAVQQPDTNIQSEYEYWVQNKNSQSIFTDKEREEFFSKRKITEQDFNSLFSNQLSPIQYNPDLRELPPLVSIKGQTICKPKELSCIAGGIKSGKTFVAGGLISSFFINEHIAKEDVLQFVSVKCPSYKVVILIDTEQSEIDLNKKLFAIKSRIWTNELPSNLIVVSLRRFPIAERIQAIRQLFAMYGELIHFVLLDGIGDLVTSVNDEMQCNNLIDVLLILADEANTNICSILHENPSGNKLRGHLGSQYLRKCESTIVVSTKNNSANPVGEISSNVNRNAPPFEPVYFQFDEDKGYHISIELNHEQKKKIKKENYSDGLTLTQANRIKIKSLLPKEGLLLGVYADKVKSTLHISIDTAKKWIRQLSDEGQYIHQKKKKGEYFQIVYSDDDDTIQGKDVSGEVVVDDGMYIPSPPPPSDHTPDIINDDVEPGRET